MDFRNEPQIWIIAVQIAIPALQLNSQRQIDLTQNKSPGTMTGSSSLATITFRFDLLTRKIFAQVSDQSRSCDCLYTRSPCFFARRRDFQRPRLTSVLKNSWMFGTHLLKLIFTEIHTARFDIYEQKLLGLQS